MCPTPEYGWLRRNIAYKMLNENISYQYTNRYITYLFITPVNLYFDSKFL